MVNVYPLNSPLKLEKKIVDGEKLYSQYTDSEKTKRINKYIP